MKIYANAKINLCLDVTGKREDGYHNVCMIMQEIDLCDEINIELTDSREISLVCDSEETGDADSNIAVKAARLFFEKTKISKGCIITLSKNIPVCAGLGGGSSDGAAVLKALNVLCSNPLSEKELEDIALRLGADVPFFIRGKTALCEGIGEILTPLSGMEEVWIGLIKPNVDISTKEAYKKIDNEPISHPDTKGAGELMVYGDMEGMYGKCANVFEEVMGKDNPEIDKIRQHFLRCGAKFSMMSGSGPTVFGVFKKKDDAVFACSSYGGIVQCSAVAKTVI